MQDDLLRTPVEYDQPHRKDNLFLWTVFLLLLVGFSMACWIGSYLIFSRPELPFSYKILRKIKKIDPPAVFKVNAAPPGEFLTAEKLYDRYVTMSGPALRQLNRDLERAYLRNYPVGTGLVPYVTGRFTIMDSYELHSTDFVPSGAVVLAESSDFSKVMIEQLYTSNPKDAPLIKRNLQTGMDIELRRTFELTAVLHIAKLPDGHMQLTVVPINYGHYLYTGTNGGFDLHPPAELNVTAGWPVVRDDRLAAASEAYLDFRTRVGGAGLLTRKKEGEKPPPTAIKGVDVAVADETPTPPPAPVPVPTPAVAKVNLPPGKPGRDARKPTPAPAAAVASATPLLAGSGPMVLPALPVNEAATPVPRVAVATPRPVVKAVSGGVNGGVSLQPFLAGAPTTNAPANGGGAAAGASARSWPTYPPGRMPAGRNVRVSEITSLSRNGSLGGEPVYLTGQFVVRAVGENKTKGIRNAVLRSSGADGNVRVIVEFPGDRSLPSEGSEISRDDQRPYQIMDVRQVEDGTLNVFAREISE